MAYFRDIKKQLQGLLKILTKQNRWLILMNADPDALASAMALKKILVKRVQSVGLAQINVINRPDNLSMIKYLRIPSQQLTPQLAAQYDKFALVDSQPHHNPVFDDFSFSMIIDHHPILENHPVQADYLEILPNYGSTSSILTEYLYNLGMRPGKLLATALMYGIKTDTSSFERHFCDADIKAFRYLNKFADQMILKKIIRSEFRIDWLYLFSQAIRKMRINKDRLTVFMNVVDSDDILVILADFFLKVHEVSWSIVSGIHNEKLIVIFRGDGIRRDMGKIASQMFHDVGPAGGHKAMARAEIPLEQLHGTDPGTFLRHRFQSLTTKHSTTSS